MFGHSVVFMELVYVNPYQTCFNHENEIIGLHNHINMYLWFKCVCLDYLPGNLGTSYCELDLAGEDCISYNCMIFDR